MRSRLSQRLGWINLPIPPRMPFPVAAPDMEEAVALAAPPLEHQHPLTPRDEAVFLLHVAAEIEHSLMVQYLYAWLSLHDPADLTEPNDPDDPEVHLLGPAGASLLQPPRGLDGLLLRHPGLRAEDRHLGGVGQHLLGPVQGVVDLLPLLGG